MNRIQTLFDARGIKVSEFARENNITASTLYAIIGGQTKFEKISVSVFIKIANGLGMTAEELYYGDGYVPCQYSDPRQTALNEEYEHLSEIGKDSALGAIRGMRLSERARGEADGTEGSQGKIA